MMFEHVDDLLPELALGTLPQAERSAVESHLAGCARCVAELAATADVLASLSLSATPVLPSVAVRDRLRASVQKGGRLARFAPRLGQLIDISVERAQALLDRLDPPPDSPRAKAVWLPMPLAAGIWFHQPEVGPRLAGATVACLRLSPDARFPGHKHLGAEQVFTMQGGYLDEQSGREWGAGEVQEMAVGTSHSFIGVEGADCICVGVVLGHIEIDGIVF